jgi:hypothetical protein
LWWIIVVAPIEEVDKQLIIRQEYHIGLWMPSMETTWHQGRACKHIFDVDHRVYWAVDDEHS